MDNELHTPGKSIFNLKKQCINMMEEIEVLRYIVQEELCSEKYDHFEVCIMHIEEAIYNCISKCDGYLDIIKHQQPVDSTI